MLHCVMICCIKPYYNIILSYIIFYFVSVCACRYLQQHAQTYTWMVPRRRVTASPPHDQHVSPKHWCDSDVRARTCHV